MIEIAYTFLEFIIIFLLLYVIHKLFFRKRIKKYNEKQIPINVKFMIIKYKIDVKKIGFKKVFDELCMCDSFIVALLFMITKGIDNTYIRLIVCFILMFPIFMFVYYIMSIYYKKRSEK